MNNVIAFIPKKLDLLDHPEFNVLPLNVLMTAFKKEGENIVQGYALYEPDLSTFNESGGIRKMIYENRLNKSFYLIIEYVNVSGNYKCTKYKHNDVIGMTVGKNNWNLFFANVGTLGLENGEACELKTIKPNTN